MGVVSSVETAVKLLGVAAAVLLVLESSAVVAEVVGVLWKLLVAAAVVAAAVAPVAVFSVFKSSEAITDVYWFIWYKVKGINIGQLKEI